MLRRLAYRPVLAAALLALSACSFDSDGVGDDDANPDGPGADGDGDGIADSSDNCPDVANGRQEDEDGDGVGNFCDNCPHVTNPNQTNEADGGGDNAGDACDPDPDTGGNDIVMFEPFDDPARMDDWPATLGGDWQIVDGGLRQNATGQHTTAYFGSEQFGSVLVETSYVASSLGAGPNNEPFEFGLYTAFAVAADPGAGYLCLVTGDAPGNNPGTLRLVTNRGNQTPQIEGEVQLSSDIEANRAYALRAVLDTTEPAQLCQVRSDALTTGASTSAGDNSYEAGLLAVRTVYTTGSFEYVIAFAVP
jgi:hypothetical protein